MSDIDKMNVGLRWYVAHTYSGYESKVKANLEKIVENRGLGDLIYDVRIPVETVVEKNGDTEKTVEVPIIGLNFPGDKVLRTFPSKARVTFRVGSSQFSRYTADNFVLAATYEELLQNPFIKYRLHLKSLPEGVSNVRIVPQEVDYLIEQTDSSDEGDDNQ